MCALVCLLAAGLFWESETETETQGQSEKDKEKNLTSNMCRGPVALLGPSVQEKLREADRRPVCPLALSDHRAPHGHRPDPHRGRQRDLCGVKCPNKRYKDLPYDVAMRLSAKQQVTFDKRNRFFVLSDMRVPDRSIVYQSVTVTSKCRLHSYKQQY